LWERRPNNCRSLQRLWKFERLGLLKEGRARLKRREARTAKLLKAGEGPAHVSEAESAFDGENEDFTEGDPSLYAKINLPRHRHEINAWDRFIFNPVTNVHERDVTLQSPNQAMVRFFFFFFFTVAALLVC
jgi:hypothetical protein